MRLCKFTFTIISSIPCLHTFCHAIPTSFYIYNVFKVLYDISVPDSFMYSCYSFMYIPATSHVPVYWQIIKSERWAVIYWIDGETYLDLVRFLSSLAQFESNIY